jgi:Ca2+-binding RTX toxin-like protein
MRLVTGTDGDDTLIGGRGGDTLVGEAGNDLLNGNTGKDTLLGGEGNDLLAGQGGSDVLTGGAGNDEFFGSVFDWRRDRVTDYAYGESIMVYSGSVSEDDYRLVYDAATDTTVLAHDIDGAGPSTFSRLVLLSGRISGEIRVEQAERHGDVYSAITFTPGDARYGSQRDDFRSFRDVVTPLIVLGLRGNDTLAGGAVDDLVKGGTGDDVLKGRLGDDTLLGGYGADRLLGGRGDDLLVASATGGAGVVYGGAGSDVVHVGIGGGVADGGAGAGDHLQLDFADGPGPALVFDFASGADATFGTARLVQSGFETIGIATGWGDDVVTGGKGGDSIAVSRGANSVDAGAGRDVVAYATGAANLLDGGAGYDVLRVDSGTDAGLHFDGGRTASDGSGSVILGFEAFGVEGSGLDDTLKGGAGSDTLYGGSGQTPPPGRVDGIDRLIGRGGDDVLFGGGGRDNLNGGGGNDDLFGGEATDRLTGGAGSDRFRFLYAEDFRDRITDFGAGDELRIRASALGNLFDPDTGEQYWTVSRDVATTAGPEFVLTYDAGTDMTRLMLDANGTARGGLSLIVQMDGNTVVSPYDIVIE